MIQWKKWDGNPLRGKYLVLTNNEIMTAQTYLYKPASENAAVAWKLPDGVLVFNV